MKVDFINKEYLRESFFKMWGTAAATCYNTPVKHAEKVGLSCMKSGHFSGSRGMYFTFKISDVPRSLVDQLVRHEQGVFKNVQSFRYVSKDAFAYYTPTLIANCPKALVEYDLAMQNAAKSYAAIQDSLREFYSDKIKSELINQSARGVIPMNTNTELVIGLTLEALIHLMNIRLCARAEESIRKLTKLILKEVVDIFPELKEKLVVICEAQHFCPEGDKCCGRKPNEEQFKLLIKQS